MAQQNSYSDFYGIVHPSLHLILLSVLTIVKCEDLCYSFFVQHYVTPDSLRHGATTVLGKQPDIPQEKRVEFIPVEWRSSLKLDEGKNISA